MNQTANSFDLTLRLDLTLLLETCRTYALYHWRRHGEKFPWSDYLSEAHEALAWVLQHWDPQRSSMPIDRYARVILSQRLRYLSPARNMKRSADFMNKPWREQLHEARFKKHIAGFRGEQQETPSVRKKVMAHWKHEQVTTEAQYSLRQLINELPKERDRRILNWVCEGYTQCQIADLLEVSEGLVSQIMKRLVAKLRQLSQKRNPNEYATVRARRNGSTRLLMDRNRAG